MKTTFAAATVLAASFGLLAGKAGVDIVTPEPAGLPETFRAIVATELGYDPKRQQIYQKVHSATPEPITGVWSAKVTRNGRVICVGGGKAPYNALHNAERNYFTPTEWAGNPPGAKCPEQLEPGDVLLGNWEFQDGAGGTQGTSRREVVEAKNSQG